MKKRKVIILGILLLLFLSLGLLLWILFGKKMENQSTVSQDPYLELTIKDAPESIDTVCEKVVFLVEAKNTGKKTLTYESIQSNSYSFSFVQDTSRTIIGSTHPNAQGFHNLYVDDFGSIGIGETKVLSFSTKEAYLESYGFGYQNGFNMLQSYGNSTAEYYFEFQRVNGENSYTVLSNLPKVAITLQAFEYSGSMWSNKLCD